ncbi:hypothetical protein PA598K_03124 [Paenibacillus sp. 598K]|uniref:Ger(x)C family spore germination protein n=1 Tax=Paenibacillus sp. 598K TaxID=1117987 RepID=UPI000FFA6015|nr:Ger(x)C family spore germination protein [Paenibacillus sp. 598K]GBF74759.1 hypothetical protein PA598K_03124 [Paenibacillus sp. 598K]
MSKWRRRGILVGGLLAGCLVLTGCWNRIELNEIGIVSATAVDMKEDGRWVISYQLVIPQSIAPQMGGNVNVAPVNVFSTEGESFRAAISKASREMSRKLYFAHNQIVVISDQVAKGGIDQVLEVYMRNNDARETVSMFLARGEARTILEQLIPGESIPGAALQKLVRNEVKNGTIAENKTVMRVLLDLLGPSQATVIPSLLITGDGGQLDTVDIKKKTHTRTKIRIGDLGVIRHDQLVGWLNMKESAGVMWLKNQVDETTLSFGCSSDKSPQSSSVRVTKAKIKVTPVPKTEGWTLKVSSQAKGVLLEYMCPNDLDDPQVIHNINERVAEEIKLLIQAGWQAASRLESDVIGFGQKVHEKYPKEWHRYADHWGARMSAVDLDVTSAFKLERVGFSNRTFHSLQEQGQRRAIREDAE